MKQRVILHSDMNNFYASVECARRTDLRNRPMVVGGNEQQRHGIVLAKNMPAKALGIRTGETLWQARTKCPGLIVVPPDFSLYRCYAERARKIYRDYTPQVEPFGLDEAWLDVSGEDGVRIANDIRRRIRAELDLTVSVGVSFNKIFAKLGSDLKKPDATTLISRENFRSVAWPLPVEALLYVGPVTKQKLSRLGIDTIGELAAVPVPLLRGVFGKTGDILHAFANGSDSSPVRYSKEAPLVKSIGNSATAPRDLICNEDVKILFFVLCECVGTRLRENGLVCRTVAISVRDNAFYTFERQIKLPQPTNLSNEIADAAMRLFVKHYRWPRPVRSLGVRCTDLADSAAPVQLPLFGNEDQRQKRKALEETVDALRRRYGYRCIQRASVLADAPLCGIKAGHDDAFHA